MADYAGACPEICGPFLHAGRLVFRHPTDGRKMEFEAPLPLDLQTVLNQILPEEYERSTS